MMRAVRLAGSGLVLALALGCTGVVAGAQDGTVSGPTITLDRYSMRAGDRVLVTLDGFKGNAVTLGVCGNQARRGSVDCNMAAGEGVRLDRDGSSTLTEFPVAAPVPTCPCLIRASTRTFDQLAVAPIELVGHPVGPIVGSSALDPLEVSVSARRSPHGFMANLRSAIGGPTAYTVTVSVRNRSPERLENIVVAGSAGRSGGGDVTALELPAPGTLEAGKTWVKVVRSELPAPVLGTFVWRVAASGAGAPVNSEDTARSVPLGFLLLALIFVVDMALIAWRRLARHRLAVGEHPSEPPDGDASVVEDRALEDAALPA